MSFDEAELCKKILLLKIPSECPASVPPDISLLIKAIIFPQINENQIQNLQKNQNSIEILKALNFSFPIVPTILLLIEETDELDVESSNYVSIFVLYSYLSWTIYKNEKKDFGQTGFLLNAFPSVINSDFSELLFTAYHFILLKYAMESPVFELSQVFQSVCDFSVINVKDVFLEKNYQLILDRIDNDEDRKIFISFLYEITSEGKKFSKEFAVHVIRSISPSIIRLEKTQLQLFSCFISLLSTDFVLPIISVLPNSLFNMFNDNFIAELKVKESKLEYLHDFEVKSTFEYSENETFVREMTPEARSIMISNEKDAIFDDSMKETMDLFAECSNKIPQTTDRILSCFEEKQKQGQMSLNIVHSLIYIVSRMKLNEEQATKYFDIILETDVFNPKINTVNEFCDYEILYEWRVNAIKALSNSSFAGISELLKKTCTEFFIFPVVMQVLLANFNQINKDKLKNTSVVESLTKSSCYFQIQHKKCNDETRAIIEFTRKEIFKFFSLLLDTPSLMSFFFAESSFSFHILSLLCEAKTRKFALNFVLSFIHKEDADVSNVLITQMKEAIVIVSSMFPDDNYISTASDILKIAQELLKTSLPRKFIYEALISVMIDALPKLSGSIASHVFFLDAIKIIGSSFGECQFDTDIYRIIGNTARSLNNEEYLDPIMNELKTFLSGGADTEQMFFIKNAQILAIMLEKCSSIEEKIIQLNFIKRILTGSLFNTKAAYEGKLDSYILSRLCEMKEDENEEFFSLLLSVVEMIEPFFMSEECLAKIVTLLLPLNTRIVSIYHQKIMESIMNMIISSTSKPHCYLTLDNKSSPITLLGVPESCFSLPFSIGMKIFVENINSETQFALARMEANAKKLDITLSNNIVSVGDQNFDLELERGQWTTFGIEFTKENDFLRCTLITNGYESDPLFIDWNPGSSPIDMKFGVCLSKDVEFPIAYISELGIYNTEADFLWMMLPETSVFNIKFGIDHSLFKPILTCDNYSLACANEGVKANPNENIVTCFSKESGVKALIIAFLETTMKTAKGERIDSLFDLNIEILKTLFLSEEAQNAFVEGKCLQMISRIIIQMRNKSIRMYYSLYDLLKSVTVEKLQKKILRHLILNYKIWEEIGTKYLLCIFKHWNTVVFPCYSSVLGSVLPITGFADFVKENCSKESNEHNALVKEFMHLMIQVGTNTINLDNLLYIIGECLTCTNISAVKVFLSTLKTIASKLTCTDEISEFSKDFLLLHHLISYSDEEMYIDIIDIYIMCYEKNLLTSVPFENNVKYIISVTPQKVCTKRILTYLVDYVNKGHIELVSLCSLVACELGDDSIFIENVKQTNGIIGTSNRLLWMLIMFGRSKYNQHAIFDMIYDESRIELIGTVLQILQAPYLCDGIATKFLEITVENALLNISKVTTESVCKLLEISYYSIFFQMKSVNDIWAENLIEQSPFAKNQKRRISSLFLPLYVLLERSIDRALNEEYVFALRMSESGKWLDCNFAVKLLALFERFQTPDLLPYDLCLCAFLLRSHPIDVKVHLKVLKEGSFLPKNNKEIIYKVIAKKAAATVDLSFLDDIQSTKESEFMCIENIACTCPFKEMVLIVATKLKDLHKQNKAEERKIMTSINKDIVESTINKDAEQVLEQKRKQIKHVSMLNELWKSYPELAKSKPVNYEKHLIRDEILCNGVPLKLKENEDFNNHEIASKRRDDGTQENEVYSQQTSDENLTGEFPVILINVQGQYDGFLNTKNEKYEIITTLGSIKFNNEDIEGIYQREYLHEQNSAEIFLVSGNSYFLVFKEECPLTFTDLPPLEKVTRKWTKGKITNFEYIMELNRRSSRSFNVLSQYPIMPWVLKNYDSSIININDPSNYRDFSLPVALNVKEKADRIIQKKKNAPYMFSYAQSCPMNIFYYFIREEPFTTKHIQFQGGKFDHAGRIFQSIKDTFENEDFNNELTPEFFCSPEFLVNRENFDLGLSENNGDVLLPRWCQSAQEFVYMNRRALESTYASRKLNEWIDLIWGVSQKNKLNSYDPCLCKGEKQNKEMMKELGVVPIQLFTEKHPVRDEKLQKIILPRIDFSIPAMFCSAAFGVKKETVVVGLSSKSLISGKITEDFTQEREQNFKALTPSFVDTQTFYAASPDARSLIKFTGEELLTSEKLTSEIVSLKADKMHVITTMKDSLTHIWSTKCIDAPLFSIISDGGEATCCAVCSKFDACAIGTSNGFIRIVSITQRNVVHDIFIEEKPLAISISPGFGYIVAFTDKKNIVTLSINGERLKVKQLPSKMCSWCFWINDQGFDTCAVHLMNGSILYFDVFALNLIEFGSVDFTSCSISLCNSSSIVVLSSDGRGSRLFIE